MADMQDEFSPSFDVHRDWIEKVITDTPTPCPSRGTHRNCLLTGHGSSPEHVLRGSKSFAARSFRSRNTGNSLRVPSSNKENYSTTDTENSRPSSGESLILGEIQPNGQILRHGPNRFRPSPTPSLKKSKAEAIVKAHGSPQHVRVTAGGRIVPSEQSPLCHPRYGYSAIKTNGGLIKFAPNQPMGKGEWTQATQNGFVAQDVNGRLCQIVNGTILPLNEVDGALRLYVPAPNLNITSRGSSFGPQGTQQRAISQGKPPASADPPIPAQTNALELEYSKLECELKDLDKTEVLHGRTMGKAAKDALIGKRRELVVTLDNIRKAIKSIRSIPPADAPISPRALRQPQKSMSPPQNRLPAFLQQRMQHQLNQAPTPAMGPGFDQMFGMQQPQQFSGPYGFQHPPASDVPFDQRFGIPPPAMFVQPPPFDGSMPPPFPPFHGAPPDTPVAAPPMQPERTSTAQVDAGLPQHDGASSFADPRSNDKITPIAVASPRQSHAVDIKMPEPKAAVGLRSTLNPMSPAYKPGSGVLGPFPNVEKPIAKSTKTKAPTPLQPLHELRPSAAANKPCRTSEAAITPAKESPHLHSSSIDSFQTADFFPRNTREYSTRKHNYAEPSDPSEDKENVEPACDDPDQSASRDSSGSDVHRAGTAAASKTGSSPLSRYNGPAPPPGTPLAGDIFKNKPQLPVQITTTSGEHTSRSFDFAAIPDRQSHNISPKSKRQEYLFMEEHPSRLASQASSSPDKIQSCRKELSVTSSSPADTIDFSEASAEWLEGYRAGLARRPVGFERAGDFLDGYCAGLLKSKPANNEPSTGSPTKSTSRRPSPGVIQPRSSSRMANTDTQQNAASLSPFETRLQSMDTFKEAVLAPQNENAVLTPGPDSPHVSEAPWNLGAWAKAQGQASSIETLTSARGDGLAGFPFPHRTSSMLKRQGVKSETDANAKSSKGDDKTELASITSELSGNEVTHSLAPITTTSKNNKANGSNNTGNRVSSMTSIDSNLYRQYPGHRVFSPHLEWKSATSVAHAAGLAAGYFSNAQSDGAHESLRAKHRRVSANVDVDTTAGSTQPQIPRVASITSNNTALTAHSRFREGSLDGMSNPPNSPQPMSPPMSPSLPAKDISPKKRDSPSKSNSPAKVKFERIAEKVGITVSAAKKEDGGSPTSPPGKRRWRDVWRGSKKEGSKDDSIASTPYA